MSTDIPSEFESFVASLIARRRYLSKQEVLSEGLRLLQAKESLGEEVQKGFEQIANGECSDGPEVFSKLRSKLSARSDS